MSTPSTSMSAAAAATAGSTAPTVSKSLEQLAAKCKAIREMLKSNSDEMKRYFEGYEASLRYICKLCSYVHVEVLRACIIAERSEEIFAKIRATNSVPPRTSSYEADSREEELGSEPEAPEEVDVQQAGRTNVSTLEEIERENYDMRDAILLAAKGHDRTIKKKPKDPRPLPQALDTLIKECEGLIERIWPTQETHEMLQGQDLPGAQLTELHQMASDFRRKLSEATELTAQYPAAIRSLQEQLMSFEFLPEMAHATTPRSSQKFGRCAKDPANR